MPLPRTWFSRFGRFVYDTSADLRTNFDRLAVEQNWREQTKRRFWPECQEAEFALHFSSDTTKLEKWQELCRTVGIEEVPRSITQCRKALGARDVLVNLCNLIDHYKSGVAVIRFPNYRSFLDYTRENTFPLRKAKEDGFIKALLRKVR